MPWPSVRLQVKTEVYSSGHLGPKRKWKRNTEIKKRWLLANTLINTVVWKEGWYCRFNLIMVKTSWHITIAFFGPKCLFPESIVWYILMGAHFLFNSFLMHVSHPDKKINKSSYYTFLESAHIIYTKNLRFISICSFPWTILQNIHINLWQKM